MSDERLWAPWRIGYVTGETETLPDEPAVRLLPNADASCFLCQGAVGPSIETDSEALKEDGKRLVVARLKHSVVLLNRYPYSNGHLLVAPRLHQGSFGEITPESHAEITQAIARCLEVLERKFQTDGFNVGLNLGEAAGAGLPGHLHWHIVPRWSGDHNFMPTVAGTRMIPQSLDAAWEVLHTAFDNSL